MSSDILCVLHLTYREFHKSPSSSTSTLSAMDFADTRINCSDTPISYQDHDHRDYSPLDSELIRLRSQIFESSYRKTDLISTNHKLSLERDAFRRRNRELEPQISEVAMITEEMKRDVEVYRERVSELEGETKEKSILLSKISESLRSMEDRLLKGGIEKPESEEYISNSVLELIKEVETKVETLMESMEKKKMGLSRSVEFLKEENRGISVLLRAALSEKQNAEKQLKEMNEQKRSALLQIAERGLQRIGFGFGFAFRESVQEVSETGKLVKDEEEEEENGVVIVIEKTMKDLRLEISQLKISLEESRLEEARLKKFTEEQAQIVAENKVYIDKLQNREKFLAENVEELMKAIIEAESEVGRWREACEIEVEAGQREVEARDQLVGVFKAEVEKLRSALSISEGKIKLKEELAKAAMVAEAAAEKSLRLAERRISDLLSRIERLYRQLEEAESAEGKRRKFRYVWCWPLWSLPTATAPALTACSSSSYISNRALLRYDA